jgi:two-component system, OmpR family, sensor kinase
MTEARPGRPARPAWSLRRRLVLGIVALLALVSVAIGAASVLALRQSLMTRLDEQVVASLRGPVAPGGEDGPERRIGSVVLAALDGRVARASYTGEDGVAVGLDDGQVEELLAVPADGVPVSVDLGGDLGGFRVAAASQPVATGGGEVELTVVTGQSLDLVDATITSLWLIFAGVAGLAIVAAAFAGAAVVRVALRPLDRVEAAATRVAELPLAAGDVAIRENVPALDTDERTEVGRVGAAVDRMIGHVEHALAARQESEQTLRRFVADASHELRTPLASIRGYSELSLRVADDLPEDVRRSLGRIDSESVRMTSLVEDLLLLARLDAGDALRREPVPLAGLVVDAVSDAHVAGPDRTWELDLDDDAAELVVLGDPNRLHQVVANLLGNARAHTPPGTTVTARLERDGDSAVLTVADDGPGVPAELRPRLFERFVRGDDARSRAAGSTGLGLSIVAAIVHAHGGRVALESEPGATAFRVELPVAPAEAAESPGG